MHQGKAIIKTLIAFVILYLIIKTSTLFFSPFLFSVLLCIIIEPIAKKLIDNLHLNRSLSIIIALLFFCGLSTIIIYFTVNNIYCEIVSFIKNAPKYYYIVYKIILKYEIFIRDNFNIIVDGQSMYSLNTEKIILNIIEVLVGLKDRLILFVYSLPDIMLYITFSIIAAFFILRDKDSILSLIGKSLPEYIINIISSINKSVINIIKAEVLLMLICIIQLIIGFILVNVDYALVLGIFLGILELLPFIGPGIVFVPWIIYSFASGKVVFAASLLALYTIIIITRQVLEAKLMSSSLELHPLVILISIYIGLEFYGIIGTLLGPIMASVLKMIYKEYVC